MKKVWIRWMAMLLALAMLLAGCNNIDAEKDTSKHKVMSSSTNGEEPGDELGDAPGDEPGDEPGDAPGDEDEISDPWDAPKFEDMEYTRPDMDAIQTALDTCNSLVDGGDSQALYEALEDYAVLFNDFTTNYYLAHIRYNLNLKDSDWEEEYNFCSEQTAHLSADTDHLLRAIAASDHRDYIESQEEYGEGYFDEYEGDSLWTDRFTQLMAEDESLCAEYYAMVGEDATYEELLALMVEMVQLRAEIAQEAGYDDYISFVYEYQYGRDYSVEQVEVYLEDIKEYLVPLADALYDDLGWADCLSTTTTKKTFSYVENMAENMGGVVAEAFQLLSEKELYHIKAGSNKMDGAFEVFLPDYQVPFVFMCPTKYNFDHLTFAHEFGHFCNDYASGERTTTIDVAEIFSQGMENLSLFYGNDVLEPYRMASTLLTYTEQGAYAEFEIQLYSLAPEDVTVENIESIFMDVTAEYGVVSDPTMIQHFYVSAGYVISYVVSNDVALQFYEMELEEEGSGLACYMDNLDNDTGGFLEFLESANLGSPFAHGRIEAVYNTLKEFFS